MNARRVDRARSRRLESVGPWCAWLSVKRQQQQQQQQQPPGPDTARDHRGWEANPPPPTEKRSARVVSDCRYGFKLQTVSRFPTPEQARIDKETRQDIEICPLWRMSREGRRYSEVTSRLLAEVAVDRGPGTVFLPVLPSVDQL
ncbi:hypothetical protein CKAH01_16892 [Colletotrichum kahawae]|uniref:Uncharacterized protein n=1 Tax=Colletotrichum kahawae TaxID=34407 RepID=A0AAD9YDV1_COLKA|nr:hypothetical protein CKAH01_16892 [Colletotrichum kahawae]